MPSMWGGGHLVYSKKVLKKKIAQYVYTDRTSD